MFKNVAAKFIVFAFDATTNVPKTGDAANITAYVSKDYGAVTVLADTTATEMDATNAPGYYLFDAAQGETNADVLLVTAKSATANIKVIGAPAAIYTRPTTGWLAPTVAARTLDVSAGGEAGVDWANVGSPTTAVDLSATTIKTTQKVDVDTIKTQAVTCAAGVTVLASVGTASTSTAQTGDAYARLGAPSGLSVSADVAAVKSDTAAILTDTTEIGVAGAGLTNINLPDQTMNITGDITGNLSGSVGSVTGAVGSLTANNDKTGYTLSATGSAALTESYAADGAAATLPQLLYQIWAMLAEANAAGTTITVKKLDGATSAMTFTIDDATTPTSITRAT